MTDLTELEHRVNEEARHGNREALERVVAAGLELAKTLDWLDAELSDYGLHEDGRMRETIYSALAAFREAEKGLSNE